MSKKKIEHDSVINQEIKGKFVAREVLACFSYEMEAVLRAGTGDKEYPLPTYEDIQNAYTFCCPNCGAEEINSQDFERPEYLNQPENTSEEEIRYGCESCGHKWNEEPESEPQEILEWWIVTEWLAKKLLAHNEPILEWGNNWYWGRTCSGQAILLDGVISEIAEEMEILEGQKYDWSKNK